MLAGCLWQARCCVHLLCYHHEICMIEKPNLSLRRQQTPNVWNQQFCRTALKLTTHEDSPSLITLSSGSVVPTILRSNQQRAQSWGLTATPLTGSFASSCATELDPAQGRAPRTRWFTSNKLT